MIIFKSYTSLDDACTESVWNDTELMPANARASLVRTTDTVWYGTKTFKEAIDLARNGWEEGLKKLKENSIDLRKITKNIVEMDNITYAVDGAYVDITRYLNNEPECMVQYNKENTSVRFLRLHINISRNCSYSASDFFRYGNALIQFIDALEQNKVRCEIILSDKTEYDDNTMYINILLKRAEDRLNIHLLNFALCNAAMFRRITFSLMEKTPKSIRYAFDITEDGGYGRPANINEEDVKLAGFKEFYQKCGIADTCDHLILTEIDMSQLEKTIQKTLNKYFTRSVNI